MDESEVWPAMDRVVRVGETLNSFEDPDRGKISMDKPKLIVSFSWEKKYN